MQRFRSLSEIEKYQSMSGIRIPIFDKESADFCFEKSREILSKPFNLDLSNCGSGGSGGGGGGVGDPSAIDKSCRDQKSRDIIGENLIDIENTLKALNLDFLQTFNELEKTDSAETLFGENYGYESTINPKIRSTAIKLSKLSGSLTSSSPKAIKSMQQCSPLEKQIHNFSNIQFFSDTTSTDDKRSSTPDTGFASRETGTPSRRDSQKSSYSPQDSHFNSREFSYSIQDTRNYIHELAAKNQKNISSSPIKTIHSSNTSIHTVSYSPHSASLQQTARKMEPPEMGSFPSRQRSLSFTENYELKSPVLSEPQIPRPSAYGQDPSHPKQRNVIHYKPRSIKARNLRRLSYNPVILNSSSSSSDENEFDRSIAHSECDIRSSMIASRRRRQYLNRKSVANQNRLQDKLYGSNASIKSAPQYNMNDRQLNTYLSQKFSYHQYPYDEYAYHYGSDQITDNNQPHRFDLEPLPGYNHDILYTEFDVSKLTGKSPTTQSFLQDVFVDQSSAAIAHKPAAAPAAQNQSNSSLTGTTNTNANTTPNSTTTNSTTNKPNVFHWPEKIHASTVKQNDLLWRQHAQNTTAVNLSLSHSYSSSDSSSTETDLDFQQDFSNPRMMPPSPAP